MMIYSQLNNFLFNHFFLLQKISPQIYKSSLSSGAKKGKDDDSSTCCHGIAWINLAPLLYPGVTRVKGAALVHPYIESEVQERVSENVD